MQIFENAIPIKKDFRVTFSCGSISVKHFNSITLNIVNNSNKMPFDYLFIRRKVHPEVSLIKNSIQMVLFTF